MYIHSGGEAVVKKIIEEFNGVAWIEGYRLYCDGCGAEVDRLYIDKDDGSELCEKCTLKTHETIE